MRAIVAVALALMLPAPAFAQDPVQVGLSDQQSTTLTDPLFTWLGIRTARVIAPWDAALQPSRDLDEWLAWAEWTGIEPLVSFTGAGRPLPTVEEYDRAFAAFRARWPQVTTVSVWNEVNHPGQPTALHPEAVAGYYRAVRARCPQCRVLAAEVLDIRGMTTWLARFQAALGERPRLWGLHDYGDVTRRRAAATEAMLHAVDGEVWITETGGLVHFELADGTVRWPEDEERARASLEYAFALADSNAGRIRRMYVYNWREAPGRRWDSGLLAPDGRLRPSFWALAARLRPGLAPPFVTPPGTLLGAPREGGLARVLRRPHLDRRRGRVRARVTCPGTAARCSVAMVVRTHRVRDRHGRLRQPRGGRSELGRTTRTVLPGRVRRLAVRLPRSRMRLIRRGITRSLLADLWTGSDQPRRYRVRCERPR